MGLTRSLILLTLAAVAVVKDGSANTVCPEGEVLAQTWPETKNVFLSSSSITYLPSSATKDGCQNYCASLPTCVGYVFYQSPSGGTNYCYSVDDNAALRTTYTKNGFNLYTKTEGCQPTGTTTTTTMAPTTTFCASQWTKVPNYLMSNGIDNDATKKSDCKTACMNTAGCVAIDFSPFIITGFKQCYLHTSNSSLLVNYGYTHYVYSDCQTDPSVTTTTAAPTRPLCHNITYTRLPDTLLSGGTQFAGIDSQINCQHACSMNKTCLGFEFFTSVSPQICYLHYDINDFQYTATSSGNTAYEKVDNCNSNCAVSYEAEANTLLAGGMAFPSTLREVCEAQCTNNYTCLAYEWIPTQPDRCYLHFKQDDVDNAGELIGATAYMKKLSCPDDPTPTPATDPCIVYDEIENMMTPGGDSQAASVKTNEACAAICTADDACLAYEFGSIWETPCYLQKDAAALSQTSPSEGSSLFTKGNTCGPEFVGVCQPRYQAFPNTFTSGGVIESASTKDACESHCSINSSCIAYMWAPSVTNQMCTVYFGGDRLSNNLTSPGYTTYPKVPCSGCEIIYKRSPNVMWGSGATPESTATTEKDCKNKCTTNANCKGYAFGTGQAAPCFTYMVNDLGPPFSL